ncbi:MAG TPA: VCBS repeat-containing protein, partial [Rheinheimera sp.]|nr:VCBS repeat-containing protein [Rheinheimera sp.]
ATIDVSISNFRFDMPLFQVADADGNSRKSLYVGDGQDTLKRYMPDSKRLFSKKSEKLKFALPRDARRVKVFDVNANGKEDLLLPFDALDNETLRNQLHFILN